MKTLIRQRDNLENQLMQLNSAVMLAESKEDKQMVMDSMSACIARLDVVNDQLHGQAEDDLVESFMDQDEWEDEFYERALEDDLVNTYLR